MYPSVVFQRSSGELAELRPGDLIGRSERAALCINEPHISEAHAIVSFRASRMKLIALRGRISSGGKPSAEVDLAQGQRIVLGSRTALAVQSVQLPSELLAIEGPNLPPCVLAGVCSLRLTPVPSILLGFAPDARAWFWSTGTSVFMRDGDQAAVTLTPGMQLAIGGHTFRLVAVPLGSLSHVATSQGEQLGTPLHLILHYDTVHVLAGSHRLLLDGIPARIICELAAVGTPLAWQEIARQLWERDEVSEDVMRARWDSSVARLRRKLKEARIRTDLVRSTKFGNIELVLAPGDVVEDRM